MKRATSADLRNNFAKVSKWIHDGESVVITKRGHPFATLVPINGKHQTPPPVDRWSRLQKLFPEGPISSDTRDTVDYDRGDR